MAEQNRAQHPTAEEVAKAKKRIHSRMGAKDNLDYGDIRTILASHAALESITRSGYSVTGGVDVYGTVDNIEYLAGFFKEISKLRRVAEAAKLHRDSCGFSGRGELDAALKEAGYE